MRCAAQICVLEELALGCTGVAQQQEVDVAADAVLTLHVLSHTAEPATRMRPRGISELRLVKCTC